MLGLVEHVIIRMLEVSTRTQSTAVYLIAPEVGLAAI
jgi:hypothetical protein